MMDDLLEQLCAAFEDELERQENVLAVCVAQHQAARAIHSESLNAKTHALELLIRDAVRAQGARTALFRRVVKEYNIPADRQTLSGLIAALPSPWAARLRAFQSKMRAVLAEIRVTLHACAVSLRASGRAIDGIVGRLEDIRPVHPESYDARGAGPIGSVLGPALLNQAG